MFFNGHNRIVFLFLPLVFQLYSTEQEQLNAMKEEWKTTCKLPAKVISLCESEKNDTCPHWDNEGRDENYYCWRCKKGRDYSCNVLKQLFARASDQGPAGEAYFYLEHLHQGDLNTIGYQIRGLEESVNLDPQDSITLIQEVAAALEKCVSLSKRIKEKTDLIEQCSSTSSGVSTFND